MMKPRRITLDGMLIGTKLEVLTSEVSRVKAVMIRAGAIYEGRELVLSITEKSTIRVAMREDSHKPGSFYLNLSGNPITFLTGSNVYGYPDAEALIIDAYTKCLEKLTASGGSLPKRLWKEVESRQVNIYSLEFATYTIPVENKRQLLNDWEQVYRIGYKSADGLAHEGVMDMLNLKFCRVHKDHKSSFPLKIMSANGVNEEAMLQVYDKAKKIRKDGHIVPIDIENRLRLDLNLSYTWFANRRIEGRRLKTLNDLCLYIDKRYGGDWVTFLTVQFLWALDRTCLFHMWDLNMKEVLGGGRGTSKAVSTEVYLALALARSTLNASDEARRQFAVGNPTKLLAETRKNRTHVISLAMGEPKEN